MAKYHSLIGTSHSPCFRRKKSCIHYKNVSFSDKCVSHVPSLRPLPVCLQERLLNRDCSTVYKKRFIDTIDYRVLLNCLSPWFGLSGVVFDWFDFYMEDKNQCVKVDDFLSSSFDRLVSVISPTGKARNLGVILYSDFSFSSHAPSVCRSYFVGIHDLGRIRRHLTEHIAVSVANALVSSKLYYCNSLFRSLSCREFKKQNNVSNIPWSS